MVEQQTADLEREFAQRLHTIYDVQQAARMIRGRALNEFRDNANNVRSVITFADDLVQNYISLQITDGNVDKFELPVGGDQRVIDLIRDALSTRVKPMLIPPGKLNPDLKSVTFTATHMPGLWFEETIGKTPHAIPSYRVVGATRLK